MPERRVGLPDAGMPAPIPLSTSEQERRAAILNAVSARVQQDGGHVAKPHPNRARQFMPFAALKGYHELARGRERVPEQKCAMTLERSAELSAAIARLAKGSMVAIVHYEGDRYITTCGPVTELDETFRSLRIVRKPIAFDDILSIEILDRA